jgi:hypothetical protein
MESGDWRSRSPAISRHIEARPATGGRFAGGRLCRGVNGHRECLGFIERLAVLQAVIELSEEFVEQVPCCRAMAVAVFSSAPVVLCASPAFPEASGPGLIMQAWRKEVCGGSAQEVPGRAA